MTRSRSFRPRLVGGGVVFVHDARRVLDRHVEAELFVFQPPFLGGPCGVDVVEGFGEGPRFLGALRDERGKAGAVEALEGPRVGAEGTRDQHVEQAHRDPEEQQEAQHVRQRHVHHVLCPAFDGEEFLAFAAVHQLAELDDGVLDVLLAVGVPFVEQVLPGARLLGLRGESLLIGREAQRGDRLGHVVLRDAEAFRDQPHGPRFGMDEVVGLGLGPFQKRLLAGGQTQRGQFGQRLFPALRLQHFLPVVVQVDGVAGGDELPRLAGEIVGSVAEGRTALDGAVAALLDAELFVDARGYVAYGHAGEQDRREGEPYQDDGGDGHGIVRLLQEASSPLAVFAMGRSGTQRWMP